MHEVNLQSSIFDLRFRYDDVDEVVKQVAERIGLDGVGYVLGPPAVFGNQPGGLLEHARLVVQVADPAKGSNHNRAAAVDVGLVHPDGSDVELPTELDAFGARARADAVAGVSPAARRNRDLLRRAMEAEGFRVNRMEWWHFDAPEARGAPLLDVPLAPAAR